MKKDHVLYAIAFLIGVLIWVAIAKLSGRREAWDSDLYYSAGMMSAFVTSFVLGWLEPERSWRWGALPFVGQLVAMLALAFVDGSGIGSLLPLGVIMFGILSIPARLTARLGAFVAIRWRASS